MFIVSKDKKFTVYEIRYYLLLLLASMPLMPYGVLSISMIVFFSIPVVSILIKDNRKLNPSALKTFIAQTLFFVIVIISLVYSNDMGKGFDIILRGSPLILFPLASMLTKGINKKELRNILKVYFISSALLCAYLCFYLMIRYDLEYIFSGSLIYHATKSGKFYLDVHPIFTSIHFVIGSLIGLNFIRNDHYGRKWIIAIVLTMLIFLLGVIIFSSKFVVLIYLVSIFGLGLRYFIKSFKQVLILMLILTVVIILIFQSVTISNKFMDLWMSILGKSEYVNSSTNIRMTLLECTYNLISDKWFLGYGVGEELVHTMECLREEGIENVVGVHNYFLRLWLAAGILSVIAFIYSLVFNFKIQWSSQYRLLYMSIMTVLVSAMLIEDYLSRAFGIALYCFINYIFFASIKEDARKISS